MQQDQYTKLDGRGTSPQKTSCPSQLTTSELPTNPHRSGVPSGAGARLKLVAALKLTTIERAPSVNHNLPQKRIKPGKQPASLGCQPGLKPMNLRCAYGRRPEPP